MDAKDKFLYRDRLINGITNDGKFRISILKATNIVETARQSHNLNLLTATILGRLLIGATLSTSVLKNEERIQIKIDGNGILGNLTAEANAVGEVRGKIENPTYVPPNEENLEDMIRHCVGFGNLHLSKILYGEEKPYVSSVEIVKSDITNDLVYYYAQSEQIPTGIKISIDFNDDFSIKHAYGVLIQAMPDASDSDRDKMTARIKKMESFSKLADQGLYIDEMLNKLLTGYQFKELSRRPVDFYCPCNKERFYNAISSLNHDEIKDLAKDAHIEVSCDYCSKKYRFDQAELKSMLISKN